MRVLIACEYSGIVREAFKAKGHDAWSCDLLPTEIPGQHIQDDVLKHLNDGWDMMIAHPPCTYLAVSGNRWMHDDRYPLRHILRADAIKFFMKITNADIPEICIENPICIMSSIYRKPDQYIQPYEFGHPETKKTSIWLKNLLLLKPSNIVIPEWIIGKKDGKRYSPTHYMTAKSHGKDINRQKERSRTYQGIADAMASQWG